MMTAGPPAGRFARGCAAGFLASSAPAIGAANAKGAAEKGRGGRFGFMPPIVGRSWEWQKAWKRRSRLTAEGFGTLHRSFALGRASRFFNAKVDTFAAGAALDTRKNVWLADRPRCKSVRLLRFVCAG